VKPVQRRQKAADVIGALGADALEVDAGGEDAALPGQHDGLGVAAAQAGKARGQRLAELDIERIGLAMTHCEDGDAVIEGDVDHARTPCAAAPATVRLSRCQSRSACRIAAVNTTIATIWCASASGSAA